MAHHNETNPWPFIYHLFISYSLQKSISQTDVFSQPGNPHVAFINGLLLVSKALKLLSLIFFILAMDQMTVCNVKWSLVVLNPLDCSSPQLCAAFLVFQFSVLFLLPATSIWIFNFNLIQV